MKEIQSYFLPSKLIVVKSRPTVYSTCLTKDPKKAQWFLLGFPDDRGIKNNFGRPGANHGPTKFREFFYSQGIQAHAPAPASIYDLGDLKLAKELPETLERLKEAIHKIILAYPKAKICVIGGGHDGAYSEIAGTLKNPNLHHVINLDAHSDVRPLEENGAITSGTPFYRLITESKLPGKNYHPFGLQKTANSASLVQWMKHNGVDSYWLEDMITPGQQLKAFQKLLAKVVPSPWHLNIDLDGFGLEHAPGVSAPGVFGLHPNLLLTLKKNHLKNLKTLGIFELSPPLDEGDKTSRLAAKLAYWVMGL